MFLFHRVLARRPLLTAVALATAALLLVAVPAPAQQGWQFFGGQGTGYPGAGRGSSNYSAPAGGYSYAAPAAGYTYSGPSVLMPGYVYSAPAYYGSPYSYAAPSSAAQTAAYYGADMVDGRSAVINMRVPANATVRFGSEKTTQTGAERRFISPALQPGRGYTYDVHVQWKEGDRTVDRNRTVDVRAGQQVTVDVNN
jgi:uncharacterized protein (TIGR03000 family)